MIVNYQKLIYSEIEINPNLTVIINEKLPSLYSYYSSIHRLQ